MAEQQKATQAQAVTTEQESSLLDQIIESGRLGKEGAKERGKDMVKEFIAQVLEGSMTVSKDAEAMINARIAQIDHLLSLQLNEVLHHPAFQKLESSWRGLKYLMDQSETSDHLKIKILNVSKRELLRDLQRAPEFDQSARGVWFGLRLHHTKFELAKSVMEGVTFLLKKNLAALEETGGPVEEIISLGGGSKSAVWNQMKADVTGKRVIVPSMSEPTSLGAAILASIKCGWFGGVEEAVERGVDIGRVFEPRNPERYERLYERFLELYERLKPVFHGEGLT